MLDDGLFFTKVSFRPGPDKDPGASKAEEMDFGPPVIDVVEMVEMA